MSTLARIGKDASRPLTVAPSEPEANVIASTIDRAARVRAGRSHQGSSGWAGAAPGGGGTNQRPSSNTSATSSSDTPSGGQSQPSNAIPAKNVAQPTSSVATGASHGARRA